jgi:MinD superfamily P-loop ATPase
MTGGSDVGVSRTIAIASGKGGTGKTLVATNLAALLADAGRMVTLVDCDVEAPNDRLFLAGESVDLAPVLMPVASVDEAACTSCGACRNVCRYGAIRMLDGRVLVFPELCHGCGACALVCSSGAMGEEMRRVGEVETTSSRDGLCVVTGRLDIGEVKSPTVVRSARAAGEEARPDIVLLDAPPGVACVAVAAVRGSSLLLLVTEPTAFGMHDLDLAVRLGSALGIPMAVAVNRVGTGEADIEAYCAEHGLPVVACIPFDREVAAVYAEGRLLVDAHPMGARWFGELWENVERLLEAPERALEVS